MFHSLPPFFSPRHSHIVVCDLSYEGNAHNKYIQPESKDTQLPPGGGDEEWEGKVLAEKALLMESIESAAVLEEGEEVWLVRAWSAHIPPAMLLYRPFWTRTKGSLTQVLLQSGVCQPQSGDTNGDCLGDHWKIEDHKDFLICLGTGLGRELWGCSALPQALRLTE